MATAAAAADDDNEELKRKKKAEQEEKLISQIQDELRNPIKDPIQESTADYYYQNKGEVAMLLYKYYKILHSSVCIYNKKHNKMALIIVMSIFCLIQILSILVSIYYSLALPQKVLQ